MTTLASWLGAFQVHVQYGVSCNAAVTLHVCHDIIMREKCTSTVVVPYSWIVFQNVMEKLVS